MTTNLRSEGEDALMASVLRALSIPSDSLNAATSHWRSEIEAVIAGLSRDDPSVNGEQDKSNSAIRVRDSYSNLKRLKYEYHALNDYYASKTTRTVLFAIDPHVIATFCDYADSTGYKGFDFLESEWNSGSFDQSDKQRFLLQLCSAIFQKCQLGITAAGRDALAESFSFFSRQLDVQATKRDYIDERLARYEELIESLNQAVSNGSTGLEKLDRSFRALTAAGSASGIYSDLALSRMNSTLRAGKFLDLRSLISQSVIGEAERSIAVSLFERVRSDRVSLALADLSIDKAFNRFLDNTVLSSNAPRTAESDVLLRNRNTEHLNRRSVVEIHLANLCLEAAGAIAEIRYVTYSNRLFNFLEPLLGALRVPCLHPRFLFGYQNVSLR